MFILVPIKNGYHSILYFKTFKDLSTLLIDATHYKIGEYDIILRIMMCGTRYFVPFTPTYVAWVGEGRPDIDVYVGEYGEISEIKYFFLKNLQFVFWGHGKFAQNFILFRFFY